MEWAVRIADDAEREIANATHPGIRFFDVPRTIARTPREDCGGDWKVCDPATIAGFSAVGYFFGRELATELGVPVGLIGANWGGTVAEAWTSAPTLRRGFPEFGDALDRIEHAVRASGGGRAVGRAPGALVGRPGGGRPRRAGGLDGADARRRGVEHRDDSRHVGGDRPRDLRRHGLVPAYGRAAGGWKERELVLEIGPVDDMDLTWFNGTRVGETRAMGRWNTPRSYRVPAGVAVAGPNVIAVCAVDTGGVGRLGDDADAMRLALADGSDALSLAASGATARARRSRSAARSRATTGSTRTSRPRCRTACSRRSSPTASAARSGTRASRTARARPSTGVCFPR